MGTKKEVIMAVAGKVKSDVMVPVERHGAINWMKLY